jgi:hypothetical protein
MDPRRLESGKGSAHRRLDYGYAGAIGRARRESDSNHSTEVKMSPNETSSAPTDVAAESPVLIHVWDVQNLAQEGEAIQHLCDMLAKITTEPGFVSGRVLQSADHRSIAVVLEVRTVDDGQRLEHLPLVRGTLDHLNGVMNIIIKLYQQVAAYNA